MDAKSYLVQFGRLAHVGRFAFAACGFATQGLKPFLAIYSTFNGGAD